LERIRFAVLKLSGGSQFALLYALRCAQIDWRDVLAAAGFADSTTAHEAWAPEEPVLTLHRRWREGDAVEGVRFSHNDGVKILKGEHVGTYGSVISLVEVAPSPTYLVELSTGQDTQVAQSALEAAG